MELKYFDKLDEILAAKPATRPPVLVEILKPVLSHSDETDIDGQDDNDNSIVDPHGQSDVVTDDTSDNTSGSSTASVSGTPHSHHSSNSVKDDTEDIVKMDRTEIKGKKRRRSKGEVLDDVITKAMKVMTD